MFGKHIRRTREALRRKDRRFSLRQVAFRIGVEPSYLSKVEREGVPPPSEGKIKLIAGDLGQDADVLLAMAGKVSRDLQDIIRRRPAAFAGLLRALRHSSDEHVAVLTRAGHERGSPL